MKCETLCILLSSVLCLIVPHAWSALQDCPNEQMCHIYQQQGRVGVKGCLEAGRQADAC